MPLVPFLKEINPIHNPRLNFPKICFNSIIPSMPRSSEWSLSYRLSNHNAVTFVPSIYVTTFPTHFICFDFLTLITVSKEYILQSSSLFRFLQPYITSTPLQPNILLRTPFSNILPLKRWQTSTRLHGTTTHTTSISILFAMSTSNPTYIPYHEQKNKILNQQHDKKM
jgi:hypothetical protein